MASKTMASKTRKLAEAPDMMRSQDAAALLGISSDTVVEMCRRGELPAAKMGKFWIIPKAQLVNHIESIIGA